MMSEEYFFLNVPHLPAILQVGERQPFGYCIPFPYFPFPILEAADLRTELRYNVFQLLTVYLENRGPFTAHSKTPSSSPDFQIQRRGAWQAAHVNKYQPFKKVLILD